MTTTEEDDVIDLTDADSDDDMDAPESPWLAGLNDRQREAVLHSGGPLIVVAGAGSGKTKTLASRVARVLADGTPANRVLLLTFTRRAARGMVQRAARLCPGAEARGVYGGTFHSVAARLLRRYGTAVGLDPGFTVLDQADATELFDMLRSEAGLAEKGTRFPKAATVASIYSRVVNSQNPLTEVLATKYPWCADHAEELGPLFRAYMERKRSNNVVDYDDLLLYWRALGTSPTISAALADTFDHVLVDEYQDTNTLQAEILASMCPDGKGLAVVGDDAQAIYGFRAASSANMIEFDARWPDATLIVLDQNYRSTPQVLALSNRVMEAAKGVHHKELWSDRPNGALPKLVTCIDETEQANVVCDAVLDGRERGVALMDQAVLFRTGHHSDGLEMELARRSIPFVKFGGLKFLEAAHIKDLLALLRVLDNPRDTLAWHRVLTMFEGVGPARTRKIVAELGLDDPATSAGSLERFLHGEATLPKASKELGIELATAWADCAGEGGTEPGPGVQIARLSTFCAAVFPRRYDDAAARMTDIEQLATLATEHNGRGRFLADLTLDPPVSTSELAGPPHLDDDYLTLSTIHSAKGGEWNDVYVIHAADGNIPSDMSLSDREGVEEERRLLYVALTRAKDELTVTYPLRFYHRRHGMDDAHTYAQPSRFLDDIDPLVQRVGAPGVEEDAAARVAAAEGPDPVHLALDALFDS